MAKRKKIRISPSPSINDALKSELKAQADATRRETCVRQSHYNAHHGSEFGDFLLEKQKGYYDDYCDFYGEDDDDDIYDHIFPSEDDEDDDSIYGGVSEDKQEKEIYFIENIVKDDYVYNDVFPDQITEQFTNVKELRDYCTENGINIPKHELNSIRYRTRSYCTINPIDKAEGSLNLMSEWSWQSLYALAMEYADSEF